MVLNIIKCAIRNHNDGYNFFGMYIKGRNLLLFSISHKMSKTVFSGRGALRISVVCAVIYAVRPLTVYDCQHPEAGVIDQAKIMPADGELLR